jgi:hypothetical protein
VKTKPRGQGVQTTSEKISLSDEIPQEIKNLDGKTPSQIIKALLPNAKIEPLAGLMYGVGIDLEIPIPEFAKNASKQFWKYYFGESINTFESLEDQGAFARLLELIHKDISAETATAGQDAFSWKNLIQKYGRLFATQIEKEARGKHPIETAEFFEGRIRGQKAYERINNPEYLKMAKRAGIYECAATYWQQFERFHSYAEAERWLRAQKAIGENVSSREVSAALKLIGLPSRGPGRPKKPKPDVASSQNQDFDKRRNPD